MRQFLFQILVFTGLVASFVYIVLLQADGETDAYYLRFTSPPQQSLIIGTSRAAQGLQPKVFEDILDEKILNYAFSVGHSSFGPTYFKSIEKKLLKGDSNGVFIVTVDPWSISSTTANPEDSLHFREIRNCLGTTKVMSAKPNIDYLINSFNGHYYKCLFNSSKLVLHEDGWLEVNIEMDKRSVEKRIEAKVKTYELDMLPDYQFSKTRLFYLVKLLRMLNQYGDTYLVRLPIHPSIMAIEERLMPDFVEKINDAINIADMYMDMNDLNRNFSYTDGNHLHKNSGAEVSEIIAKWIMNSK